MNDDKQAVRERVWARMTGVQVLDEDLPETDHDFRVDIVVTTDEVVRTGARRRPGRIDWSELDDEQLAAIPALAKRAPQS